MMYSLEVTKLTNIICSNILHKLIIAEILSESVIKKEYTSGCRFSSSIVLILLETQGRGGGGGSKDSRQISSSLQQLQDMLKNFGTIIEALQSR